MLRTYQMNDPIRHSDKGTPQWKYNSEIFRNVSHFKSPWRLISPIYLSLVKSKIFSCFLVIWCYSDKTDSIFFVLKKTEVPPPEKYKNKIAIITKINRAKQKKGKQNKIAATATKQGISSPMLLWKILPGNTIMMVSKDNSKNSGQ